MNKPPLEGCNAGLRDTLVSLILHRRSNTLQQLDTGNSLEIPRHTLPEATFWINAFRTFIEPLCALQQANMFRNPVETW